MTTLALAVSVWAVFAALFSLVASFRLSRLAALREGEVAASWPPVLLLRPMDAPTPHEVAGLASPIDYPGPLEQVVLSPFRPRLPIAVRWLWSDPLTTNRKAGHLAYALSVLPTEGRVVLSVDADVAVDGALVKALVAPLLRGAALATTAWVPTVTGGWGARALRALLLHTHHSFLALHVMSAGAKSISGKAMGLGAAAQRELPHIVQHIGEDLELSRRLHEKGEPLALALAPARAPQPEGLGAPEAVARVARWQRVLKAHRPSLYPSVPLLFAPSLPLLALALFTNALPALGAVAFLFAARTLLAARLLALRPGEARGRWDACEWVLGEALLLSAFVGSLRGAEVTWRGRVFRVRPGGVMEPLYFVGGGL